MVRRLHPHFDFRMKEAPTEDVDGDLKLTARAGWRGISV
jgi:hypothetical protein